jgi:hypothetical protein
MDIFEMFKIIETNPSGFRFWISFNRRTLPENIIKIGEIYYNLRWTNLTLMELELQYDEIYHYFLTKFPDLRKYNHKIYPRTQLSVGEPTGTSGNYHPNPDLIFKFM